LGVLKVSIVLHSIFKMEIKERIALGFEKLVKKYGVKRVTLDELASEIGISKKTIYQHFEDKTDIVRHVFIAGLNQDRCVIEDMESSSKNMIEQFFRISKFFQEEMEGINPIVFYDLKKFYPNVWTLFVEHKNGFIRQKVGHALTMGKQQGLVRDDVNVELAAILHSEMIEMAFNEEVLSSKKFRVPDVHVNIIEFFLYGVCTLKGHKLINKHKNINEDE
jgi:TetR/AcrR family transcriptional regulator, cholesterol catabolism regulator